MNLATTSRWTEVTPSPFPHEQEGLNKVKSLLPNAEPFRAWSNFEFRDDQGRWHEVDLVVVGRRRIHLVELKYYAGTIRGDDLRWQRDGHPSQDSPLKLARRKAQRLASKLRDEAIRLARDEGRRPPSPRDLNLFVQECVFLHHAATRCDLPISSRIDLFGLDGQKGSSGLDGISDRLLEAANPEHYITPQESELIAQLIARIGVVQRRQREVGSWIIDDEPVAEGDGWQEWTAAHRVTPKERVRIRFQIPRPGAPEEEARNLRAIAEHEYRLMLHLSHEGLLRPKDLVDCDLGIGLVYPEEPGFQRLDLWLADRAGRLSTPDQLSIIRQIAETLQYAHANRVVHRGLTPAAIWVKELSDGAFRVRVGGWQTAGRPLPETSSSGGGITDIFGAEEAPGRPDLDRRLAGAYAAPEFAWDRTADRVVMDVFSAGAVAYFIVTGRPPASDSVALRERTHRDHGLDLATDLPQVPAGLRTAVLKSTHPFVSNRLHDMRSFIAALAEAEKAADTRDQDSFDPLDQSPGAILAGRFELRRRLGAGSTAVALLAADTAKEGSPEVVLKVAIADSAARRLEGEAEVLEKLKDTPRIARLLEPPIDLGGRRALVLESAGSETLADALRDRRRLSLDLLERWGIDLLEALVALDRAGVHHRDIKPANLGVREGRGDRVKHLVLFDFSLSRAAATALNAGTPPYLDPFLAADGRQYDSAAERYAAAVVLFEMATGETPEYGERSSHPASVGVEATIRTETFDPAVADRLAPFFRRCLARSHKQRIETAADMLATWKQAFAALREVEPTAERDVETGTPLREAGLSPRAISALEPLAVQTVGDLLAVDAFRLNRLRGVAEATRVEIRERVREWRERLGEPPAAARTLGESGLPDPASAAQRLLEGAGGGRADARRRLAALVLGLEPGGDAFMGARELAEALAVSRARGTQLLDALQNAWESDRACGEILEAVATAARQALTDLGGVATVSELTEAVLLVLPPAAGGASASRATGGLLRFALDRLRGRRQGDEAITFRRRDGRVLLVATDAALLDAAEAAGAAADELVRQAEAAGEMLVPAGRAAARLREVFDRVAGAASAVDGGRLARLAGGVARVAATSAVGELHSRDLPLATALGLALQGVTDLVRPGEVQSRVRARFPALGRLPERPRLDELVAEAGLTLEYDDEKQAYHALSPLPGTREMISRHSSIPPEPAVAIPAAGPTGERLQESAARRSFLALAVDALKMEKAIRVLSREHRAINVDITRVLIDAMRSAAAELGIEWATVRSADAASPESREGQGIRRLVSRVIPQVDGAIESAAAGGSPVLLTEAGVLARYGHLSMLARWSDLTSSRPQAVWLLVPQLLGNRGALIDGVPVPLAAPGQLLKLEDSWIDAYARAMRQAEAVVG